MNKIYYSQIDSRWKDYPYPSQALPKATIGSGGCGTAAAAMIVSMLRQIVTPIEIARMFLTDGIRVNGGTSNKAFDSYIANKFDLQVNLKWKLAEAKECLERGGLVVALCKKGLFTNGGHFIVLTEFKNNEFLVYDPYLYKDKFGDKARLEGTNVYVTFDNMKEYGGYKQLWCFEPTGINTNISIPTSTPVPNRNTVGQTAKLARNCTLYSNSNLTGTTYNYLKNTRVQILENVSEVVDRIFIPATNRYAYINITNYTEQAPTTVAPEYRLMTVTARSGLNVRSLPTTNSNRVTCYAYGTRVKVYSIANGWAKGTKGYMSTQYLV